VPGSTLDCGEPNPQAKDYETVMPPCLGWKFLLSP
jgi:hypothetical protein